ncbi:MAG: YgfZ/GcvT domain-containing protein [Acidiferrobacterales bacterium]
MLADWKTFLLDAGAVMLNGIVEHFGDPRHERQAVASGNIITDLSSLSLIRVEGDDAAAFLQGQLTNDIYLVGPARSQLSAYCNPKGRILGLFRVFMLKGNYVLQLPVSMTTSIVDRLKMYVLRSKVTPCIDQELQCIGIAGPNADSVLRGPIATVPSEPEASTTDDGLTVVRTPGTTARFKIVGTLGQIKELWLQVKGDTTPVGSWAWRWMDIVSGIPNIYPSTSEMFVPQMANLDLIGGVSFDKGCYAGQEIVARMQYLGRLKQRMHLWHIDTDAAPDPGYSVFAASKMNRPSGTVVDAQPSPVSGCDVLAVVRDEAIDHMLHLGRIHGPPLIQRDLPYPVSTVR